MYTRRNLKVANRREKIWLTVFQHNYMSVEKATLQKTKSSTCIEMVRIDIIDCDVTENMIFDVFKWKCGIQKDDPRWTCRRAQNFSKTNSWYDGSHCGDPTTEVTLTIKSGHSIAAKHIKNLKFHSKNGNKENKRPRYLARLSMYRKFSTVDANIMNDPTPMEIKIGTIPNT